jgi:hypothetical protein
MERGRKMSNPIRFTISGLTVLFGRIKTIGYRIGLLSCGAWITMNTACGMVLLFASITTAGPWQHTMLLADEGGNKVYYINPDDATKNWTVSVTENRSMQLVGLNRVLVSTLTGFVELDLGNRGSIVRTYVLPVSGGTVESAFRMASGVTWVIGSGIMGRPGIVLARISANNSAVLDTFSVKDSSGAVCSGNSRYTQISRRGTFYCGTNSGVVWEVDTTGTFIGRIPGTLIGYDHGYQATDWGPDSVVVSNGGLKQIFILERTGQSLAVSNQISGSSQAGDTVKPNFFGGFQILLNGNIVATNWEGHSPADRSAGIPVLEYDKNSNLISCWRQSESMPLSIHGILVLDGLNTNLLHDSRNGPLMPVGSATSVLPSRQFMTRMIDVEECPIEVFDLRGVFVGTWCLSGNSIYALPLPRACGSYLVCLRHAEYAKTEKLVITQK